MLGTNALAYLSGASMTNKTSFATSTPDGGLHRSEEHDGEHERVVERGEQEGVHRHHRKTHQRK